MSWLKSPWFWLLLILAIVAAWFLFFRSPARAAGAPSSVGHGTGFFGAGGFLDSIEARFSIGDSIMGGTGSG